MGTKGQNRKPRETLMTKDGFFESELPHLLDIVSFCGSVPMSAYSDSIGVKSPEAVYRGLAFSTNRFLSEEYLLNYRRSDPDMGMLVGVNNYRMPMVTGALAARNLREDQRYLLRLPSYTSVNAPIGAVIRSRRSIRRYSGKAVSLRDLSTVLFHAQGVSGNIKLENMPQTATLEENGEIQLRMTPSGGGLYPISLYLFSLHVEGLDKGAYLYVPECHALKPIVALDSDFDVSQLAKFGEIEAEKSSVLIVYVYTLYENSRKYGDSGLAFAFLEAGAISEHVHLICTALGLGPCDVGGYAKRGLEKTLGVDGLSQHVIHLTVIGI